MLCVLDMWFMRQHCLGSDVQVVPRIRDPPGMFSPDECWSRVRVIQHIQVKLSQGETLTNHQSSPCLQGSQYPLGRRSHQRRQGGAEAAWPKVEKARKAGLKSVSQPPQLQGFATIKIQYLLSKTSTLVLKWFKEFIVFMYCLLYVKFKERTPLYISVNARGTRDMT